MRQLASVQLGWSVRGPRGHSLLELLVALALSGIVATAVAGLLHAHVQLAAHTSARALRSETLRISTQVLSSETRWLQPERDVRALARDSLALRALRAAGTVCQLNPDGSAVIALHALRAPDAAKDSALILRDSIQEVGARVLAAQPAAAACSGRGRPFRVRLSVPLEAGDVALIFETGTYYMSERALRYRLGGEGRQPLTSESLDDARSFFAPTTAGGYAWLGVRSALAGAELVRVRLPFLNYSP